MADPGSRDLRLPARVERLAPEGLFELACDEAARAECAAVLGAALPHEPLAVARGEWGTAYGIGPSRWLLRVPAARESPIGSSLGAVADRCATAGHAIALSMVSDAFAGFRITGDGAPELIAEGCPLDLQALCARGTPACARTVLARVTVLVVCDVDAAAFELWVESSYADYLARWLDAASR